MPKPIYLDKDTIIQLYHHENLKMREVADKLGVCKDTVRRNMRHYDILPKAPIVYRKGQDNQVVAKLSQAQKLYCEEHRPLWEICKQLEISFITLRRLLVDNGIRIRTIGESIRLSYSRNPHIGFQRGRKHPRYNNGRTKDSQGYIRINKSHHHRAGINGYVFEHILVWEEANKMPLPEGWTVHHLNGVKDDNRPENLLGMPNRKHHFVLAEKAKHIRVLENRIRELEKSLLEATKMNLP